ncbi:glucan 1,3-beta-glucosidase [Lactarius psammicola]|nr:glucan 1,3-beta-glucosidase [Lactarius psammicola]
MSHSRRVRHRGATVPPPTAGPSDTESYPLHSPSPRLSVNSPRSSSPLTPPRPSFVTIAADRRSWSAVSHETDSERAPTPPTRAASPPTHIRAHSDGSKYASPESDTSPTTSPFSPSQSLAAATLMPSVPFFRDNTPPPDATPPLRSSRAPPSAFHFPFQAYGGNPDPGLPIPNSGYRSGRSSMESLNGASTAIAPAPVRRSTQALSSQGSHTMLRVSPDGSSWADHDLEPPYPHFMAQGSTSQRYRNSDTSASGSTHIPSNNSGTASPFRAPFLSPASRPSSVWSPPSHVTHSHTALPNTIPPYTASELPPKAPLPSTLLSEKLTEEEKPWLNQRPDGRTRASRWITLLMLVLGVFAAGLICFFGYKDAGNTMIDPSRLCLVMEDNFDSFDVDNGGTWTRDVEMSGFGNGEFEMATALSDNSFVRNGQLYIKPTLTSNVLSSPDQIFNGGNYTLQGCTTSKSNASACSASSNSKTGATIPPVMSARLSTKGSYNIRFGKVEVVAKLPRGDWLWPAIWMSPLSQVYGPWPLSGEIDIMEARGNGPSYPAQGNNFVRSTLAWGPLPAVTARLFGWQSLKRSNYAQKFHTYTLEWTDNFIKIYVDSRLKNMVQLQVDKKQQSNGGFFWKRGNFPLTAHNNTAAEIVVPNPWTTATVQNATNAAPFDQPFYLILDLAAGGTSDKPWFDGSASAMRDFANQQSTWSATWPSNDDDLSFRIDSVRMWKLC